MSAVKSTNATGSDIKQAAWDDDRMDKVTSPMVPFNDGLWLLKLLGLPLKCNNEKATEFADKGRFLKCILLTQGQISYIYLFQILHMYNSICLSVGITSVISIFWFGNLFAHGIVFEIMLAYLVPREWISVTFVEAANGYGFKKWDVYALFIFWLPSNLISVVFYFLYKGLGNQVSEFVRLYMELDSLITGLTGSNCLIQKEEPKLNLFYRMRV